MSCVVRCICEDSNPDGCCGEKGQEHKDDSYYIQGPDGYYQANRFLVMARDSVELLIQKHILVDELNAILSKTSSLPPTKKPIPRPIRDGNDKYQNREVQQLQIEEERDPGP